MGYMTKGKLLEIALGGKHREGKLPKGSRDKDIDEELEPQEDEGLDEHDLRHDPDDDIDSYADGGVLEAEGDADDDGDEPERSDETPDADDDEGGPSTDDDEHAVVGDLVQSGLTHEQSMAIVDAIRALKE